MSGPQIRLIKAEQTPTERCRFSTDFVPIFRKTKPRNCQGTKIGSFYYRAEQLFSFIYLFEYEIQITVTLQRRIWIVELACHNPLGGNHWTEYLYQDICIEEVFFRLKNIFFSSIFFYIKTNTIDCQRVGMYEQTASTLVNSCSTASSCNFTFIWSFNFV